MIWFYRLLVSSHVQVMLSFVQVNLLSDQLWWSKKAPSYLKRFYSALHILCDCSTSAFCAHEIVARYGRKEFWKQCNCFWLSMFFVLLVHCTIFLLATIRSISYTLYFIGGRLNINASGCYYFGAWQERGRATSTSFTGCSVGIFANSWNIATYRDPDGIFLDDDGADAG